MKLRFLLHGTDVENQYPAYLKDMDITGIAYNSQLVEKGNAFVCIKGYHTDGHIYAMDAAFHGASIVFSEEKIGLKTIPVIITENSRRLLSKMSANFYERKDKRFRLFGVTGTNGKTTITYMLKNIIETCGESCGVLGTIGYRFGNKQYEAVNTTPESYEIHKLFAEMKDEDIENCVMEVSSHALALDRVADIPFQYAIFTNLTPDHMDFHESTEDYYQAKRKLFYLSEKENIINLDDEYGRKLIEELKRNQRPAVGYSLTDKKAEFYGEVIETNEKGTVIRLAEREEEVGTIEIHTPGIFTIYNCLAAAAAARAAGIPFDAVKKGLQEMRGVPGRFELVENSKGMTVIVDYAHTPDALEKVLKTAAGFKKGRLICVFGCGGDRDKKKRSLMGAIAGENSDYCIVTSDNPRTEKQEEITADIEKGIYQTACKYDIIENRYEAIKKAVSLYQKGDIIMIAGKGHEDYQIIGTEKMHFDDRETVKNIIENGE